MSRLLSRTVIALAILAVAALLVRYVTRERPVAVVVRAVDKGRVEATVANTRSGTVKACQRARLAPATGGQIAHLPVREGDRVEANQVLLSLWNEDLAAEMRLAENAEAASRASAEEACLLAGEAEREAGRRARLRKGGLIPEADYDQAVTTARARREACNAARANAEVGAARVSAARAGLERTVLRAPFAGTVAEVNGEVGEFVTPSPTGIATLPAVDLIDSSCLFVSAPIDEVDAEAIRPGMEARISLDAFPGRSFRGEVRRIAPYVLEVEKQARTVEVETQFADPVDHEGLLPGYSADVEIVLDARAAVLRIPTEALLEGNRVLVFLRDEGRLEGRPIAVGLSNWRFTEVVSGISEGESVVTTIDREGVKPGALVRLEEGPTEGRADAGGGVSLAGNAAR